jgi:pilus assembly protein Flp/PilA
VRKTKTFYNKLTNPVPNLKEKEVSYMCLLGKDEGQGLVEYSIVILLMALVVMAALMLIAPQLENIFSQVVSGLS